MRVLVWHVHGSYTDALVRGEHEYLLPCTPDRGPYGLGRAGRRWPPSVREVSPGELREEPVDVAVLQRPEELALAAQWTGRRPGRELPALYLEHNTPGGSVPFTRHPLADQDAIPIVHCTHFNALMWDNGRAPVTVIEHGIVDPGELYTGELPRAGLVVNDPLRRGRATGTDLFPALAAVAPIDVYGMGTEGLGDALGIPEGRWTDADLDMDDMHTALARRRLYVHTTRWTSLSLSLLEAMHLGMPVVALATTEAVEAIPVGAGVVTTRVDGLLEAVRRFVADSDEAARAGKQARQAALARYGLGRFLSDWDRVLGRWAGRAAHP